MLKSQAFQFHDLCCQPTKELAIATYSVSPLVNPQTLSLLLKQFLEWSLCLSPKFFPAKRVAPFSSSVTGSYLFPSQD